MARLYASETCFVLNVLWNLLSILYCSVWSWRFLSQNFFSLFCLSSCSVLPHFAFCFLLSSFIIFIYLGMFMVVLNVLLIFHGVSLKIRIVVSTLCFCVNKKWIFWPTLENQQVGWCNKRRYDGRGGLCMKRMNTFDDGEIPSLFNWYFTRKYSIIFFDLSGYCKASVFNFNLQLMIILKYGFPILNLRLHHG